MKRLYLFFLFFTAYFSNSTTAFELGNPTDVRTVLGNRSNLLEKKILWQHKSGHFPDVIIDASNRSLHEHHKSIEVFYHNKSKSISLFKEPPSGLWTERITSIDAIGQHPILFIKTFWHSQGASGQGNFGDKLYIFIFNNNDIKKTEFELTNHNSNGFPSANKNNSTYLISGSHGNYSLFLDSMLGSKLFSFDLKKLSMNEVMNKTLFKERPSYDCENAKGEVESTICKDTALAALDSIMASLYSSKQFQATVQKRQISWIKDRNTCKNVQSPLLLQCLVTKYKARINELAKT